MGTVKMVRRVCKRKCTSMRRRRLSLEQLENRRVLAGPYAPPAGVEGSTAVSYIDPQIKGWASEVVEYLPGAAVSANFQDITQALGPADLSVTSTVSLGRGGQITLAFQYPIRDGLGSDFAVFENGVSDTFLELATVEVSSDGINFFAFPSDSLTSAPVDAFGALDATEIDGLAGKYRVGFGTPFDLGLMRGVDPALNVNRVTHIRLIDVVGDGSIFDSQGDAIYDPFPTIDSAGFDLDGIGVMHFLDAGEHFATFEDVGASLADVDVFHGPISGGQQSEGEFGEWITSGWFQSGGLEFNNTHSDFFDYGYTTWSQWAYSNHTDTTTSGYGNQFSSIVGSGVDGSSTYGVAFVEQGGVAQRPTIRKLPGDSRRFESLWVTNTTYAALSMLHGDSFAKQFGGMSGDDEDFFRLTITGKSGDGTDVGTTEVYLADYRFADNADDFILDHWIKVDLSDLAAAESLEFSLDSSDVGDFGMNTPAYFAVDSIQLNEEAIFFDVESNVVSEGAASSPISGRVTRINSDLTAVMSIDLSSEDATRVSTPSSISIPAGLEYFDFIMDVVNDEIVRGDQNVLLNAISDSQTDSVVLTVLEDDQLTLSLDVSATLIDEASDLAFTVSRNSGDLASPLTVSLSTDSPSLINVPEQVVIPAGQVTVSFMISAVNDDLDRADQVVQVSAGAVDYVGSSISLDWRDNDEAMLTLTSDLISFSEADALPTVGFELVGRTMAEESYLNGSDQAGGFFENGVSFGNDYDPQYGSWSGWAISNTSDVTTPGYLNQYSAFTGRGDLNSETYAVASAYGYPSLPSIIRDTGSSSAFHSISIANTTYAAMSMLQGDAFAKRFGGESGDDPDWLLLTIEGLDSQQQSVGVIDFYLADYRFEDNQLDYVLDTWEDIQLDSIASAVELRFSMSSSDVGDFGMNTPAYFAIDQLVMTSAEPQPEVVVERNTYDVSSELMLEVSSSDSTEIEVPSAFVIPAGQRSVVVPLQIVHDHFVDGDKAVELNATATGLLEGRLAVEIVDIDTPQLTVTALANSVVEGDGPLNILIHRNIEVPTAPLDVSITSAPSGQFETISPVVIPNNSRLGYASIDVLDNTDGDGQRLVSVSGSAAGYGEDQTTVLVLDDEKVLELTADFASVGEQDSKHVVSFESLGSGLPMDSYFNGSQHDGQFLSEQVVLNNQYDSTYQSWSGWAISNTTDSQTAGYGNQFSAITGSGALDSYSYAVANAYPGALVPEIVIADEDPGVFFESVMVTNTTYAYRSMLEGDAFAKKFGGDSGQDPDYFNLAIQGVSDSGEVVGEMVVPLADFRFENSADDYLLDEWIRVDLSGLTGARKLQFALESSDVGAFGMNTPAYFALDHLVLSDPSYSPPVLTLSRVNDDLAEDLIASLTSDDQTELNVQGSIVIPAGVASIEVPIHTVDDFVFDGLQNVQVSVNAVGYVAGKIDLAVEDDEQRRLILTAWNAGEQVVEGDAINWVVYRNDASVESSVSLNFSETSSELELPVDNETLASGLVSALFTFPVKQNMILEGDRSGELIVSSAGYVGSSKSFTIGDDEIAALLLDEPGGSTTIGELTSDDFLYISLASQPLGDVNLSVDIGAAIHELQVTPLTMTFTAGTWDQKQRVDFSAFADFEIEGDKSFSVSFHVNAGLSTPLYANASAGTDVLVVDENSNNLEVVVESDQIQVRDSSTQKVLLENPASSGLHVIANDLVQVLALPAFNAGVGPILIELLGGQDTILLQGESFQSLDGGAGVDTLYLQISQPIDFVDFLTGRIHSFETYHLDGSPVHIKSSGLAGLAVEEEFLYLKIEADQKVTYSNDAVLLEPQMLDGRFTHVVQLGSVQVQSDPGRPWTNPVNHYDVDGSGNGSSAVDALKVINELSRRESPVLETINELSDFSGNYYDVSADGLVTALDAIQVINQLARQAVAEGEFITPAIGIASFVAKGNSSPQPEYPEAALDPSDGSGQTWGSYLREDIVLFDRDIDDDAERFAMRQVKNSEFSEITAETFDLAIEQLTDELISQLP